MKNTMTISQVLFYFLHPRHPLVMVFKSNYHYQEKFSLLKVEQYFLIQFHMWIFLKLPFMLIYTKIYWKSQIIVIKKNLMQIYISIAIILEDSRIYFRNELIEAEWSHEGTIFFDMN